MLQFLMVVLKEIFTRDANFAQILRKVKTVAPTDANVLITGETGTGKALLAKVIYRQSQRAEQPYKVLNCAAISPDQIDSLLFGTINTQGILESVNNGTLFLDEIQALPLATQTKLLIVMRNGAYQSVGADSLCNANVRIIAATDSSLPDAIKLGAFRTDLYKQLSAFSFDLPPLRERLADIRLLFIYYLKYFAAQYQLRCLDVKDEVFIALEHYPWPGNIRELRNLAENLTILRRKTVIDLTLMPSKYKKYSFKQVAPYYYELPEFGCDWLKVEFSLLCQALERAEGNINKAATLLGLTRHTLYYRIKKCGPDLYKALSEPARLNYQHLNE